MDNILSEIKRKIKKKEQQIRELEQKKSEVEAEIRDAKARLDEQNQLLNMLSKSSAEVIEKDRRPLRENSAIGKAYEYLKNLGKPAHVTDILKGIGFEVSQKTRVSLAGSLARYATQKENFLSHGGNTFSAITGDNKTDQVAAPDDKPQLASTSDDDDIPF